MQSFAAMVDKLLGWVLMGLMAAMVLSVSWQVLSRYLLQDPSSWTEELARFLLIWIGMLGAAYAYRTKMHIGLDLLAQKLTASTKCFLDLFVILITIVFAVSVMIVGGSALVLLTLELNQLSAALGVRIGYVYTVIPLSGALISLYGLLAVGDTLVHIAKHKEQD